MAIKGKVFLFVFFSIINQNQNLQIGFLKFKGANLRESCKRMDALTRS